MGYLFNVRVISLHVCPTGATFLSSSKDNSVRLWDFRTDSCMGKIFTDDNPVACYEPFGIAFAIATKPNTIKLYDCRAFDAV